MSILQDIQNRAKVLATFKEIRDGGTVDNADYIVKTGHNGVYNFYDKNPNAKDINASEVIAFACNQRKYEASFFLHGNCYDVAALIKKFDDKWEIKQIFDGGPIHTYCQYTAPDGQTFFADARGVTNDWQEFIAEFDTDFKEKQRYYPNGAPTIAQLEADGNLRESQALSYLPDNAGFIVEAKKWVNEIASNLYRTSIIDEAIFKQHDYNYDSMTFSNTPSKKPVLDASAYPSMAEVESYSKSFNTPEEKVATKKKTDPNRG